VSFGKVQISDKSSKKVIRKKVPILVLKKLEIFELAVSTSSMRYGWPGARAQCRTRVGFG
jgi:hypothetical protein